MIHKNCIRHCRELWKFTKLLTNWQAMFENLFSQTIRVKVKNANSNDRAWHIVTQRSVKLWAFRARTQYTHERVTVYLTQDLEIPRRGHGSDLSDNWPGHAYYYGVSLSWMSVRKSRVKLCVRRCQPSWWNESSRMILDSASSSPKRRCSRSHDLKGCSVISSMNNIYDEYLCIVIEITNIYMTFSSLCYISAVCAKIE